MYLVRPCAEHMLDMQSRQDALYWSGAFDAVLRKRGIPHCPEGSVGTALVCRGADAPEGLPAVIEASDGDMIPAGIDAGRAVRLDRVRLFDAAGNELAETGYNQYDVRRIPEPSDDAPSEPHAYSPQQTNWRPRSFSIRPLRRAEGWTPLLWAELPGGERAPVAMCDGLRLVLGLPLFDIMAYNHACPPYEEGYFSTTFVGTSDALERWLLDRAVWLAAEASRPEVLLDLWPLGKCAALSIRHDYDRLIPTKALLRLLVRYAITGCRSTWFFRSDKTHRMHARLLTLAGHEVALHTQAGNARHFGDEVRVVAEMLGSPPVGVNAHGGRGAAGYLGLRQILWARSSGLAYGEMLGGFTYAPFPAILLVDGMPRCCGPMLPGQHFGLDLTMRPEGHQLDRCREHIEAMRTQGGHAVIMNHPDLHHSQLAHLLRDLPNDLWKVSMSEACRWAAMRGAAEASASGGSVRLNFPVTPKQSFGATLAVDGREYRVSIPAGTKNFRLPEC